jgi:CheY-like chemotaxis protein
MDVLAAKKARPPATILVVDDDDSTSVVLSRLLSRAGYTVHTADRISNALQVIERAPIDILISDIGLPDGTGFQLMRQVRARCNAIGIALTGFDGAEDLDQSQQAGFAEHLVKPIDFNALQRVLSRITQKLVT